MNITATQIWQMLAGLGLFLFGMYMLEEALKNLAGRSFKLFLRKNTSTPIKAVLSGTVVTAMLQSSTLVVLLVMSLAGAGIIGLNSGVGMILGANLGTTITGWIVTLVGFKMDIEVIIMPLIAIGGLGIAFLSNEKLSNLSKLLMGFSLMFLGLSYMKNSFTDVATQIDFSFLVGKPYLLFTLFGFLLTAMIHSSSASMTIYLTSLATGIITLPQAAYLMIGSDLGTSVTGVVGTINGNAIRKKVGYAQFIFNLITAIFALITIDLLLYAIKNWFKVIDPLSSLVLFHTLFNLLGILLVLPFINIFTRLLEKYIRVDEKEIAKFVANADPKEVIVGLEALEKETFAFLEKVLAFNAPIFDMEKPKKDFLAEYLSIKQYENEIAEFYVALQKNTLTETETIRINQLIASVRKASLAAKNLKDIKHNLDAIENIIDTKIQDLQKQVYEKQLDFYKNITKIVATIDKITEEDLDDMNLLQKEFFVKQAQVFYRLISPQNEELDAASNLNMLHEINKSNESLLKSIKNFIKKNESL